MREALQARAGGTTFEHVRGEVTDIDTDGDSVRIHVEDKEPIVVDKAVLALGNFPPRHPPIENRSALESERLIWNPWDPGVLDCLSRRDTVFLIGIQEKYEYTNKTTVAALRDCGRQSTEEICGDACGWRYQILAIS